MASNEPNNGSQTTPARRPSQARRASVTELFSRSGNAAPRLNTNVTGGPLFTAATNAQNHRSRRTSITTLGLSGSPPQAGAPFGTSPTSMRRESLSSSVMSSSPNGEHAVIEENEPETPVTSPNTPFARRVSFGAQALRERAGNRSGSGILSPPSASTSTSRARSASITPRTSPFQFRRCPTTTTTDEPSGEGFNWPEALRTRAERAPSFGTSPTSPHAQHAQPAGSSQSSHHQRSASVATMEMSPQQDIMSESQGTQAQPQTQTQQQKPKQKPKPDYFQEKILRADFMD